VGLVAARILTNIYDIYIGASYSSWPDLGTAVAAGTVIWLAISIPQWVLLRLHLGKPIGWLPATVLGGAVTVLTFLVMVFLASPLFVPYMSYSGEFGIGFGGTYLGGALLVGFSAAVAGLVLGFAQWSVLTRHVNGAGWWILATGMAWTVAALAGGMISEAIIESGREKWSNVANVFTGYGGIKPGTFIIALYAAISGVALVRLLQEQRLQSEGGGNGNRELSLLAEGQS
jgi:hypothetical protein